MKKIRTRIIENNPSIAPQNHPWERREFPSPDGTLTAIYSDPQEIRMGAFTWKLELLDNTNGVISEHPSLAGAAKSGRLDLPDSFQPWSFDGTQFAVPMWTGGNFIYDVHKRELRLSNIKGLIQNFRWSPQSKIYFACAYPMSCFLADFDSNLVRQLNISPMADEGGQFWWLKDGTALIALYRSSKKRAPVLELYDAHSGQSIDQTIVDPDFLVPYDKSRYEGISREGYSLQTSQSSWCVGYFLDTWHNQHFDDITNQLTLTVFRPTGETVTRGQKTLYPVIECTCTLQLEFLEKIFHESHP